LGGARSVRPVRDRVRGASGPAARPDAGGLGRLPRAEGLPGPDHDDAEGVRAAAGLGGRIRGQRQGRADRRTGLRTRGRMTPPPRDAVAAAEAAFAAAAALHQRVRSNLAPAVAAAQAIREALEHGGKLLVFGNGGSAADAQHFAAELVGRFMKERAALAAIALTTDTSVMTSVANDYAFQHVFVRRVEALGRPGDVACGISTSGESCNVISALES